MTIAQVIVEAGYARATSTDAGKLANDGELLGRLSRVFQSLFALAARARPEEFASTSDLTLAGNPATSTLLAGNPPLTDVIEIRRIAGVSGTVGAGVKIHLVPETEVYRTWQIPPTVFRRGLAIFSRAAAGDPVATDVIRLTVLDSPAALATLATVIDLRFPNRHLEILTNDIAMYLDTKDGGRRNAALMADQRGKVTAFAQEYNLSASAIEMILNDRAPAIPAGQ